MKKLLAIERMQQLPAVEPLFHEKAIEFVSYKFACASVVSDRMLDSAEIQAVNLTSTPIELYCRSNEIIFIPASHNESLLAFATSNQILLKEPVDLWGLLLDPFLDTKHEPEWNEGIIRQLARYDLTAQNVADLRQSVSKAMMTYNFTTMLWEWVHLGLYDLLIAQSGFLKKDALTKFYWDAMALAYKSI